VIIGAVNRNLKAGESYVVYGKTDDFNASFEPSPLNGSNGFVIEGGDAVENSG